MVTQLRNGIVEFRFYRPRPVMSVSPATSTAGTCGSLPMTRGPDGWWHCQLRIACLAPIASAISATANGSWITRRSGWTTARPA